MKRIFCLLLCAGILFGISSEIFSVRAASRTSWAIEPTLSYDDVEGYALICLLEKHFGLSKDNPIMFYVDALRVDVGFSEYLGRFVLSVYEDLDYAARCRASA